MNTNINNFTKGIIEGSPNMLIAIDTSYKIVFVNDNYSDLAQEIYGARPAVGDIFGKVLISDKGEPILKEMTNVFGIALGGEKKTDIYKFDQGKLAYIYFEAAFYPVKDDKNVIIGAACVAKNVTKRENLEKSLELNTKLFSLASKLAKLGPWQFDVKNNVFIFNDEIYSVYGTSVEKEGVTMSPEVFAKKIIHPDERESVSQQLGAMFNSKELEATFEFESRLIRQDSGKTIRVKVLAKIIKDMDGKILGFYGTNQDVTEQREVEERLKETQKEEENILDSIRAWIFFKDKENRFVRVNKAYAEALGKTKAELEGKSISDFYPKDIAENFWKDDLEVINSGKAKTNIIERTEVKKGGVWTQTDKIPYYDSKGEIVGVIGFALDVTQQKEGEEEIKEKVIELEKFNKMFIDREVRMAELKEEIVKLKQGTKQ